MAISIGATKQEEKKIHLSASTAPKYNGDYIRDVGFKYSVALGELSPGPDAMSNAVYTGTESRYRELLARDQQAKDENIRISMIKDIASARGGTPTEDDIEIVKALSAPQIYSDKLPTILEEAYAKRATELSATLMDEDTGILREAVAVNPEAALELLDRAEYATTRNMILENKIQSLLSRSEFRGIQDLPGHTWAWAQQLAPFWQDFVIGNAVPNSKPDSLLVGDNLDKAINYLWTLSPKDFKKELDRVEQDFMGRGDFLGLQRFFNSVHSYSRSDKAWDNVWQGIDVVGTLPVGKLALALKGAHKASVAPIADITASSVKMGRNSQAAEAIAKTAFSKGELPTSSITKVSDIEISLPSVARPHQTWVEDSKLPPAAVQRLEAALLEQDELVSRALAEPVRIDRLDANQLDTAFARAKDDIENMFYKDKYSIIDVVRKPATNADNLNYISVRFGLKNGDYFQSAEQAKNHSQWLGLRTNDFKIVPVESTGKWSIEVTRPIREDGLRGVEIETTHKSPNSWVNFALDFIRTPDDQVSKAQVIERSAVVYGSEHLATIMSELAKPFSRSRLPKKELAELEQVFKHQRVPSKATGKGTLFESVGELEEYFSETFRHLPTEAQIEAYSAYKKLSDLDWTIRNQDIYVQKVRAGIESITFKLKGLDFEIPLEGRVIDSFPSVNLQSRSNFKVGIIQDGLINGKYSSRYPNLKTREQIDGLLANGYKIVQVSGQFKHGADRFQYLVVRDFKRSALDPNQLSYNPGHKVDKFGHYLKQPNVTRDADGVISYYGDRGFANVRTEAEGIELAKRFNIARLKIKDKAPDAEIYVRDNLPITMDRLKKDIDNGFFDLNEEIHYVRSGQSTRSKFSSVDRDKFDDYTGNEHNPAGSITGRFIGEKDEFDLPTYTVENNVAHKFEGETKLSPLEALSVGLNNAVQVRIVNDYRVKSTEDFIREFGDILDGTSEDFRHGSLEFLYEPRYRRDADPTRVKRAESVRQAITSLLNQKTWVEKATDLYKERLVNSIRPVVGTAIADMVQDSVLPTIKNADQWLRAAAFHTKLGLFNPKQLFLQASAAVNVVSIAGKHGVKGASNFSQILMALRFTNDPAKIKKIAKTAVGFGPGEFEEMMAAYKRSGFSKVKGDVSALDLAAGPNVRSGQLKQVLDLGATPFNTGELIARSMSYSAAYSEWRAANKTAELTRQAEKTILARAQLLSGNMTRQSNARWQKGYLSVVTQFFGAQARLTEQMLSGGLFGNGRLTRAEKARLFLGMSAMYGVPVGTGMTVGVAPVRDMLRDWLAENEIEYDQTLAEPFIDGFASSFLELVTGGDFTVSEKYGLGGLPTFWELFKEDSTLTELLMGASGGIIFDTLGDTVPMWQGLWSTIDLNDQTVFPITVGELIEPFRVITTANSIVRLWEATNIQKWMSRNGTVLTDINETEAWISSVFGLDPERVSNAYNQADAVKKWQEHDTKMRKEISVDLTRAVQAYRMGTDDIGDTLISRSRKTAIKLGLDNKEFARLLQKAIAQEGFDDVIAEKFTKKAQERAIRMENNNGL